MTTENCSHHNGTYDSDMLHSFHNYWRLFWVLPASFSFVGLVSNGLFLVLAIKATMMGKVRKRRYSFLINLSVGDIIQFITLVCFGELAPPNPFCQGLSSSRGFLTVIAILGVSTAVLVYFSLTALQLLAIRRPLLYRTKVTHTACYKAIAGIWVLSLTAACLGYFTKYRSLTIPVTAVLGALFLIIYLATVACYSLTWYFLRKTARISVNGLDQKRKRNLVHLGVHQALFLLSFSSQIIFLSFFALWFNHYSLTSSLSHTDSDLDEEFRNLTKVIATCCALWFLRGVIDPVLHLLWEDSLKQSLLALLPRKKKKEPSAVWFSSSSSTLDHQWPSQGDYQSHISDSLYATD